MSSRTLVWDPFVRLFHWSLVALDRMLRITGSEKRLAPETEPTS